MKIEGTEKLTYPAIEIFRTIRDKSPELVALMPNIERMETAERKEEGAVVTLLNKWEGSDNDVPKVLRPFLKKEFVSWSDWAVWNEETLQCEWEIESALSKEVFACKGATTFKDEGDGCLFRLAGDLHVDPNHVPGVPRFLAKKLQEPLERFIAKAIQPNLSKIAVAAQEYLDKGK